MSGEKLLSSVRHLRHHSPFVEGRLLEAEPYLYFPFNKKNLSLQGQGSDLSVFGRDTTYFITEGWMYSDEERSIHSRKVHGAVDIHVPYGTEVLAPCDGVAIASYHRQTVINRKGEMVQYQGNNLRMGLGYFVQIWANNGRIVQLGHLSSVSDTIPFSQPKLVNGNWVPTNHDFKPEIEEEWVMKVKTGDLIGKVGFSGLMLSGDDYFLGHERPLVAREDQAVSWDESHLHLEEAGRINGRKVFQRDPYDVYSEAEHYLTHSGFGRIGEQTLFFTDQSNLPKFAG